MLFFPITLVVKWCQHLLRHSCSTFFVWKGGKPNSFKISWCRRDSSQQECNPQSWSQAKQNKKWWAIFQKFGSISLVFAWLFLPLQVFIYSCIFDREEERADKQSWIIWAFMDEKWSHRLSWFVVVTHNFLRCLGSEQKFCVFNKRANC